MAARSTTARVRSASVLLIALALATPRTALGQTNQTAAQSLFEEGRRLMNEERYAEACPKLEESQRLDPGGGTLLNLALCHEQIGRTATAWAEFNDALGLALRDGRDVRVRMAREHIAALEPKLSRMEVHPPKTQPIANLEIRLDGSAIGAALWGSAIPIDPGKHELSAAAPDRLEWKTSIEVPQTRARVRVDVPVLAMAPPPPPSAEELRAQSARKTNQIAGYSLVAGGAAAIGAGAAFGLLAMSSRSKSDELCPTDNGCTADGVRLNQTAITHSWISTGAIGVGVTAIAVGGLLLALAPKVSATRPAQTGAGSAGPRFAIVPEFSPQRAGLRFEQRF